MPLSTEGVEIPFPALVLVSMEVVIEVKTLLVGDFELLLVLTSFGDCSVEGVMGEVQTLPPLVGASALSSSTVGVRAP